MIAPPATTVVNWAVLLALALSLGRVFDFSGPGIYFRVRAADTDPQIWPRWLLISACILIAWAFVWWSVPRFSPVVVAQSRIDRAFVVDHKNRDGSIYHEYLVSFRPGGYARWFGPFDAPQQCLGWPKDIDETYSYRTWDRVLLSVRAAGSDVGWENLDCFYGGRVFLGVCAGMVLLLVAWFLTRDSDTSMHLTS